jgi:hypothetical protein
MSNNPGHFSQITVFVWVNDLCKLKAQQKISKPVEILLLLIMLFPVLPQLAKLKLEPQFPESHHFTSIGHDWAKKQPQPIRKQDLKVTYSPHTVE